MPLSAGQPRGIGLPHNYQPSNFDLWLASLYIVVLLLSNRDALRSQAVELTQLRQHLVAASRGPSIKFTEAETLRLQGLEDLHGIVISSTLLRQ